MTTPTALSVSSGAAESTRHLEDPSLNGSLSSSLSSSSGSKTPKMQGSTSGSTHRLADLVANVSREVRVSSSEPVSPNMRALPATCSLGAIGSLPVGVLGIVLSNSEPEHVQAVLTSSEASIVCMTNQALQQVPEEILQQTSLRALNLTGNQLTSLPEQLGNITSLVSLSVRDNKLETLPANLARLCMVKLEFSGNPIKSLPHCFFTAEYLPFIYRELGESNFRTVVKNSYPGLSEQAFSKKINYFSAIMHLQSLILI